MSPDPILLTLIYTVLLSGKTLFYYKKRDLKCEEPKAKEEMQIMNRLL